MHRNPLWLIFIGIFSMILIWYTYDAATKWLRYSSLDSEAIARNVSFTVEKEVDDRFYLKGVYTFETGDREVRGESILTTPVFRNSIAASESVAKFEEREWKVWYSKAQPKYSTLLKKYPFKECLYATVLWALFIYFLWLGWRVRHGNSHY